MRYIISMHPNTTFHSHDEQSLTDFIHQHSFASLISCDAHHKAHISKVPLLLFKTSNAHYLEGHLAIKNPHTTLLQQSTQNDLSIKALFDGPHYYVSPLWYEDSINAVPTWNYSSVQVEGTLEFMKNKEETLKSVLRLSEHFEKDQSWIKNVNMNYVDKLLPHIIGMRIHIKHMHGIFKVSQNKSQKDQRNIKLALQALT